MSPKWREPRSIPPELKDVSSEYADLLKRLAGQYTPGNMGRYEYIPIKAKAKRLDWRDEHERRIADEFEEDEYLADANDWIEESKNDTKSFD
jgi:hypothetical protein